MSFLSTVQRREAEWTNNSRGKASCCVTWSAAHPDEPWLLIVVQVPDELVVSAEGAAAVSVRRNNLW